MVMLLVYRLFSLCFSLSLGPIAMMPIHQELAIQIRNNNESEALRQQQKEQFSCVDNVSEQIFVETLAQLPEGNTSHSEVGGKFKTGSQ